MASGNPGTPGGKPEQEVVQLDRKTANDRIRRSWRETFGERELNTLTLRHESSKKKELFGGEFEQRGTFVCHRCAEDLYSSDSKITDPEHEWSHFPNFSRSLCDMATSSDGSFAIRKTALRCPNCGLYVGEAYKDKTHGQRHCLYSLMLAFIDESSGEVTYGTEAEPAEEEGSMLGTLLWFAVPVLLIGAGVAAYFATRPSSTDGGDGDGDGD